MWWKVLQVLLLVQEGEESGEGKEVFYLEAEAGKEKAFFK